MANYYLYPEAIIIKVSGKDAGRYLQARLSNDINKLSEGESCLAACLTPQGKTEALFTVYKAAEEYLLFCSGGDPETVKAGLARFIVADRVDLEFLSPESKY